MKVRILGVRKSETKGRRAFNYAAAKEYTQYEQENSDCEGEDVVSEFSYADYNLHPGDIVDFEYEPGYQGRATLTGVRMIEPAGNPYEPDSKETGKEETGKDKTDKKETK